MCGSSSETETAENLTQCRIFHGVFFPSASRQRQPQWYVTSVQPSADYDMLKAYRATSVTSLMTDMASRSKTDRDIRRRQTLEEDTQK